MILAEPSNQTEICSDGCWGERIFLLDREPLFPVMWRVEPERNVELERKRGTIPEDHLSLDPVPPVTEASTSA